MTYQIAHSGITWGYDASTAEAAVRDVAQVGYNAYETIGGVIEAYEAEGQSYVDLLAQYNIGLIGTYIGTGFRHGEDPQGTGGRRVYRRGLATTHLLDCNHAGIEAGHSHVGYIHFHGSVELPRFPITVDIFHLEAVQIHGWAD